MRTAYINRIATSVPPFDVHEPFVDFAASLFQKSTHAALFQRLARKAGIEHRYSFLGPATVDGSALDRDGFYIRGSFPSTAARMRYFETHAPLLAEAAIERLQLGRERHRITHFIVTSCTGFSAPGLDIELIGRCSLPSTAERTIIGFMGCYAAINAFKLAHHIVRSEPGACILALNLELCTLHFHETTEIEKILLFLLWGDGCAVSLISAEPIGLAIEGFRSLMLPDSRDLMGWQIGDSGFDMSLSGQVPARIQTALRDSAADFLGNKPPGSIDLWAVHPGGRTIIDAVEQGLDLPPPALFASRDVLRLHGNMSSATVVFVLADLLRSAPPDADGMAIAFGPGLVAETMRFRSGHMSPAQNDS
jgi:predicted naringenin-chalcone synthase